MDPVMRRRAAGPNAKRRGGRCSIATDRVRTVRIDGIETAATRVVEERIDALAKRLADSVRPPREVMSPGQAAEFLGIARSTLDGLAARGEISRAKVDGRVLYRREALLDWLRDRERADGRNDGVIRIDESSAKLRRKAGVR
jgi:excisionase family DNA binding protein